MSSHREEPEISKDPVDESADLYAFVSPDNPDTVTIIANYVPLESPDGGPNFYEFGTDVLYTINIDNDGDGKANISYLFEFQSETTNLDTFLYNTGPISSLTDPNWNRRQTYSVTKVVASGASTVLASNLPCPPCNIGPRSTPSYSALSAAAVNRLSTGEIIFAGQRADGFYVDLGAIFDLADLRPFEQLHAQYGMNVFSGPAAGVNATAQLNVHSIAIQVPVSQLAGGKHGKVTDPGSVIGVWTMASRQRVSVWDASDGQQVWSGPFHQVSRLGNPLINEVLIPLGRKDLWNTLQ